MGSWGDGAWRPGLLPGEGKVPPPKACCRTWHQSRSCRSPSPEPVVLQSTTVSPHSQGLAAAGAVGGDGALVPAPRPRAGGRSGLIVACVRLTRLSLHSVRSRLLTNAALTLVAVAAAAAHPKGQGALRCPSQQQQGALVGSQGQVLASLPERALHVPRARRLCPRAASGVPELTALCLFLCSRCDLCCCLIPCLFDDFKDVTHTCPNCKAYIYTYKRMC